MIDNDILVLIWIPLLIAIVVVQWRRRARFGHIFGTLLLAMYAGWMVSVTIFPIPVDSHMLAGMGRAHYIHNNLVPLRTFGAQLAAPFLHDQYRQLGGNFAVLAPIAILTPILWPKFRSWRSALMLAVICSLGIELSQLAVSTILGFTFRSFDVDDIWMNTMGAMVGFGMYAVVAGIARSGTANRDAGNAEFN